jgi:hypothetical protein
MLQVKVVLILLCLSLSYKDKVSSTFDVLSDIYGKDRENCDYVRLISIKNTIRIRLIQTLLRSNSPISNIVVLCCGKIDFPR